MITRCVCVCKYARNVRCRKSGGAARRPRSDLTRHEERAHTGRSVRSEAEQQLRGHDHSNSRCLGDAVKMGMPGPHFPGKLGTPSNHRWALGVYTIKSAIRDR